MEKERTEETTIRDEEEDEIMTNTDSSAEAEAEAEAEEAEEEDDEDDRDDEEEDRLSEDEQEEEDTEKMEKSLAENKYNFQGHVEYIHALRRQCKLEELRNAREYMSSIFPLTPAMWQEWAQDEARLSSSCQDVAAVEKIYDRGLQDYLSVPLWLDYLEFKKSHDQDVVERNTEGVSKMRDLFERALASAGLHFTEASKIWGLYRQFEIDLLNNMPDATNELREKQVNCIRNLFRRQLSVPLHDSKSALKDYSEWESQHDVKIGDDSNELAGLPLHVATAYKKALEMCSLRETFEEKISEQKQKDAECLQNYLTYITLEEATGDPARAQVLYERAVADFPITHDLWLKYTDYVEKNLKGSKVILNVYGRAVRNCPWMQVLWSSYMLALERANSDDSDIAEVFERSLNSGFSFSSPEEYLDHYLTRVDGIRRRICGLPDGANKQSYLDCLRDIFTQADQFLSSYFPGFVDRSLRLHSYWAWLEISLAKNVAAARGIFESLIKSSGSTAKVWKSYIAMEIGLGNHAEARTIYKRCYNRRLDGNGSEVICETWLRFEREYGSLEDYDRAVMKVMPRLQELKQYQQQQEAKLIAGREADKVLKNTVAKQKRNLKEADESSNKRPRITEVKNVDALDGDKSVHEESKMQVGLESKEKNRYTDQCTAFVHRLAPEVNEEDLWNFFASCGTVKAVRLMKDRKTGISRCFAYVDFENEEGLCAAVLKDNNKLRGSKVKVLRSDPSGNARKGPVTSKRHDATGVQPHQDHDGEDNIKKQDREDHEEKEIHGKKEEKVKYTQSSRGRGRGGRTSVLSHRRGGHVQLVGKNTFAAPRAIIRPLGFSQQRPSNVGKQDDEPKSNQDFRKMLLKE